MKIVPTGHLDWPPPYKEATERYSPQVSLGSDGELKGYRRRLPFPLVDANAPMRHQDHVELPVPSAPHRRPGFARVRSYQSSRGSPNEVEHFTSVILAFTTLSDGPRSLRGRWNPDVMKTGIASHSGAFPILEPAEMRGAGIVHRALRSSWNRRAVWNTALGTRKVEAPAGTQLSDTFGSGR